MAANKYVTPRDLKSMKTKAGIVKAAKKLFSNYGYDYMTVQSICESAKVSKGTFYHHFENKDALLSYFTMSAFDEYRKAETDRLRSLDSLQALIDVYAWYVRNFEDLGLDFTKSYFTANNETLKTRRFSYLTAIDHVDLENDELLSISHYTLYLVEKAQRDGLLTSEISGVELFNELDVIALGIVFEWCNSDGNFSIEQRLLKMLNIYIRNYKMDTSS